MDKVSDCLCRSGSKDMLPASAPQARDVRNMEVVAIKKMSYGGKQSTEVSGAVGAGGFPCCWWYSAVGMR